MIMGTCKNTTCENEVGTGYSYCPTCYNAWKRTQEKESSPVKSLPGQWHTDPVIDQMLKQNANIGKIVHALERIADALEKKE